MDYRAWSDSLCGAARSWTYCSQLGMSCSWIVVILERFPRALSFPSGSGYYNALQFSSCFFFSDVLDQSHFSG